jgi:phospholipid/cholesterol/gamma-HCH transport system ATP-binding protein
MEAGRDAKLIQLESVSLSYDGLSIFDQFDLELKQGDSLVLVGPSGSGKSSLLKLMAGLIVPDGGQVLYRGHDLTTLSKKQQAEHLAEVGMLFQQNALFDSMTIFENLSFVLSEVEGADSASKKKDEIIHLLGAVGLDHVLDHYPSEISGGMQKRLGIARALILKPRLVFYDDPTAGLDPITSRKIVSMILELKEKWGATIVTVTNDMMRAYQLAGKIMVCLPQNFIMAGSADQTKSHKDPRVQQFINGWVQGPLEAL